MDRRSLLVAIDCCLFSDSLAADWRQLVAPQDACADEQVIVVATHTHSGPILNDPAGLELVAKILPHSGVENISAEVSAYTQAT